ncbi:MAG TPA: WYL domain-containing protein [Longimicrobiales bacterium]
MRKPGPPPRSTARDQLERLLYILPAAARSNGAHVKELADALGVEPAVVLRDVQEVTARAYNLPAGAVEEFTVYTDGRRVFVHAPHDFDRPVRLSRRETLALSLGLRTIAADANPERRPQILALAASLERDLAAQDVSTVHELRAVEARDAGVIEDVEYDADDFLVGFEDDGFRGVVADAIELGRTCTIAYLKPGDTAPEKRRIAPYRLIHAYGNWYAAAHDFARDDIRVFRLDRVLDAELEEEAAPPAPASLDELLTRTAPYIATDDIEVTVRYSRRVARWIVEHTPDSVLDDDGSVIVRHRVADPGWIVRHVLQYGGEAVVEEPRAARKWVAGAVARYV